MKRGFWFKKMIGIIILVCMAVLFFGFIVMSLWNAILPDVIHVSAISFPQALGILLLSKILFGGFRGGWRGGRRHQWKGEMMNKWQSMNPEEKEKWKQDMRNKCRTWGRGFREEQPVKRDDNEAGS